jgi:hypothetical protein
MLSLHSLELAHAIVRDRLQQAADDALAQQVAAASRRPSRSHTARVWIANGLRATALRLDPSLCCEPCLTVVPVPR